MTRAADAYGEFARVYDRSLGEMFLRGAAKVLDELMLRHRPAGGRTHLDLACGTGLVLRHFSGLGWKSVGLDASLPMLWRARERGCRVAAADMRDVVVRRRFSLVTCLYDSLNHLLSEDDLRASFSTARSLVANGGMFWFDLNHPSSFENVWASSQPYFAHGEDWDLTITTTYSAESNRAVARVRGWYLADDEQVPIEEIHTQRLWGEADVQRVLDECGFELVEIAGFDPFARNPFKFDDVKQMYVTKPRRG